jgi:antitoxin CcdA
MARAAAAQSSRKAANITLPVSLMTQARALGLNISRACEEGLKAEIARSRAEQWLNENREALISSNDYVEKHGIPLSEFRQF